MVAFEFSCRFIDEEVGHATRDPLRSAGMDEPIHESFLSMNSKAALESDRPPPLPPPTPSDHIISQSNVAPFSSYDHRKSLGVPNNSYESIQASKSRNSAPPIHARQKKPGNRRSSSSSIGGSRNETSTVAGKPNNSKDKRTSQDSVSRGDRKSGPYERINWNSQPAQTNSAESSVCDYCE